MRDIAGRRLHAFHLKLRLAEAAGRPCGNMPFRLWWGSAPPIRHTTAPDGVIDEDVDAATWKGMLELGRDIDGRFTPTMILPLDRVPRATSGEDAVVIKCVHTAYGVAWRLLAANDNHSRLEGKLRSWLTGEGDEVASRDEDSVRLLLALHEHLLAG